MLAMRLHRNDAIEARPLVAEEVPVPRPAPGELLVKVQACGICRTDLHVIEGDLPLPGTPLIPGHQVVGRVEAWGDNVQGFEAGERIGIAWLRHTCGTCRFCRTGRENLCEASRFTGYHANGGFAEYAVVPAGYAYRIPERFSSAEATPLLCAGIIGFRALRRSNLERGQRLGILGFGSSAHVTLQVARHMGCEVYVLTRGRRHRDFARELGATWVGGPDDRFPIQVDSAIIFAPAGDLVPVALRNVDKGGTVALAGIHMSEVPAMSYEPHLFYEKNLRSVTANTRADGERLLEVAAEIPIRCSITPFPLEQANEALGQLKEDGLNGAGVLIPPGESRGSVIASDQRARPPGSPAG